MFSFIVVGRKIKIGRSVEEVYSQEFDEYVQSKVYHEFSFTFLCQLSTI